MPASTAARVLEQATWGPTADSIAELQKKGFDQWFAEQVTAPVSTYTKQPLVDSTGTPYRDLSGVQMQFFQNALKNPDQLRQRVAFALSEIWVVSHESSVNLAAEYPPLMDIFQRDAFAPYSTLMHDVTLNPAMGAYLNMLNNFAGPPTSPPNENYGRELMQLFTIGLNNLKIDGTPYLDPNKQPIPTYVAPNPQATPPVPGTVAVISAALTGWVRSTLQGPPDVYDPMVPAADSARHDSSQKDLQFYYPPTEAEPFGRKVDIVLPKGKDAAEDLKGALNALSAHPTMAPFVSKQLIQHLVTSNPSGTYVTNVAQVFVNTNGDLEQVVYAILTDPEARAGDTGSPTLSPTAYAAFGHLREPVLFVANLLRGLNGSVTGDPLTPKGGSTVFSCATDLGQELFYAPSVFSYFSPSYEIGDKIGLLLAPEFQLHSTQTAAYRANLVYDSLYNAAAPPSPMPCGSLAVGVDHVSFFKPDPKTTVDISEFVAAAGAGSVALENLVNERFFHGRVSADVLKAINLALTDPKIAGPYAQAEAALYIALTSGQFQIIH